MSNSEDDEVSKENAEPQAAEPQAVPSTYKTRGRISDPDATGVFGYTTAVTGTGKGVAGHVDSGHNAAAGVHGEADNATGNSNGVVGVTNGTGDFDTFLGFTLPATGVTGRATNSDAIASYGVEGRNSSTADFDAGVLGWALATSGEVFGVRGETDSGTSEAAGVYGSANVSSGTTYGVRGETSSIQAGAAGVLGSAEAAGPGVYGVHGRTAGDSNEASGLRGRATSTSGQTYGVFGTTRSNDPVSAGVRGSTNTEAKGVVAQSGSGMGLTVTGVNRYTTSGNFPSEHAAFIQDVKASNSRVLALKTLDGSPSTADNFITFFTGANEAIGAIESISSGDGISVNTSGADLGEFFPLAETNLEPEEGDVLGLKAGKLTRNTAGADAALVVTRSPAVLGNNPKAGENELPADMESVALIGQVPVKVSESVAAGDRLVAAGDGTARGGGPEDDALTVGRALESVEVAGAEGETVRAFVGGPMSETPVRANEIPQAVVEAEYEETIADLRRENERLHEANEELRSRLDDLEGTVANLVANARATSGPEPADD